jgi:hypothetical protein
VRIPVHNDAERALIERAALALDVADPIEGRVLRMRQGRCVFLADDDRCRIHAELGADQKPVPCRQFPLIALQAEDGLRVGVDPASYGAWRTWATGAALPDGPIVATRVPAPAGQLQVELQLVRLFEDPDASLTGLLGVMVREPVDRGTLPAAFAARWASRLSSVDLQGFLAHDAVGPGLRTALTPVADAAPTWSQQAPAWPGLSASAEAWAIEAVRRVLYLRLMPTLPNISVATLLLLGGVVAARWSTSSEATFHRALTGWLRALRFDAFWQMLVGDRATMVWLGTGQRP